MVFFEHFCFFVGMILARVTGTCCLFLNRFPPQCGPEFFKKVNQKSGPKVDLKQSLFRDRFFGRFWVPFAPKSRLDWPSKRTLAGRRRRSCAPGRIEKRRPAPAERRQTVADAVSVGGGGGTPPPLYFGPVGGVLGGSK